MLGITEDRLLGITKLIIYGLVGRFNELCFAISYNILTVKAMVTRC